MSGIKESIEGMDCFMKKVVFKTNLERWVKPGRTEIERRNIFRKRELQEAQHSNNKVRDGQREIFKMKTLLKIERTSVKKTLYTARLKRLNNYDIHFGNGSPMFFVYPNTLQGYNTHQKYDSFQQCSSTIKDVKGEEINSYGITV